MKPVDNRPPKDKEENVAENVTKVKIVKIHDVEARLEFQSDREPNLNLIACGKSPEEKEELEQLHPWSWSLELVPEWSFGCLCIGDCNPARIG